MVLGVSKIQSNPEMGSSQGTFARPLEVQNLAVGTVFGTMNLDVLGLAIEERKCDWDNQIPVHYPNLDIYASLLSILPSPVQVGVFYHQFF